MWKTLTLLATIAVAVSQLVRHNRQQQAGRRRQDARHDVQRWEDEGGSLPTAAARESGHAGRRTRSAATGAA